MNIENQEPVAEPSALQVEMESWRAEMQPSFASLLERYEHDIRAVIITHIPNWSDAEDVFQETCVRLLEKEELWRQRADSKRDFRAWAVTVAFYQVLTFRKWRGREQNRFSELAMELIHEEQTATSLERDLRMERLMGCIGKLDGESRQLLKLAYGGGLSLRDVALELGRTEASTYKLHARIRSALRACVERSMRAGR